MGIYLNPGNGLFKIALNSSIYVDKSPIVTELNKLVNTERRFVCISRPRRFGKTMTASMVSAYYDGETDSRPLFENRLLAHCPNWDRYLGKFNVVYLRMTDFFRSSKRISESMELLASRVLDDLNDACPDIRFDKNDYAFSFTKFFQKTGRQFVIIIDEWDSVFREFKSDHDGQKLYLDFLRDWLKDREYVALAYMTGILPIKKYGRHSALNMFDEYSMTSQLQFAPYTGFTDDEVHTLCIANHMEYEDIKSWYNGYCIYGKGFVKQEGRTKANSDANDDATLYSIYAPLSVVKAIDNHRIQNYWNKTETYEALSEYIRMDFDGLKETVARLMNGEHVPVSLGTYQNDMTSMSCRDDVLALLIHLGYLGYDQLDKTVFIPNREILDEYKNSTKSNDWSATFRALQNSRRLVAATIAGDAETIAELVEAAHDKTANRTYNSEAALSYAIQLAYYAAQDDYTLVPELDTGRGYADLVYIPKNSGKPALLIELKYNKDAVTAIDQIQRGRYPERLELYKGNIVLVGINYDRSPSPSAPDFKHHSCVVLNA